MTRAAGWARTGFTWVVSTTAFRVWQRLSQVRGSVLVSGIAYSAFFSLFPLVALAFTIFGLVLRSRTDLQENFVTYLGETFPFLFQTDSSSGPIDQFDLVTVVTSSGTLTQAGVVAVVTLIWSGLGWVTSLRLGIRAAMHLSVHDFNPVIAKIRDFVIAIVLGGLIVVSAVVSVTAHSATEQMLAGIGISSSIDGRVLTRLLVAIPILALDTGIFWLLYRFLAASPLPAGPLRFGAFAAAVAFGVLKLASGFVLPALLGTSAITASFGALVGLLVWFNLLARITLLGAAWAGLRAEQRDPAVVSSYFEYDTNDPKSRSRPPVHAQAPAVEDEISPWRAVLDDPAGPSVRAQDRTVLAAGVVLGATVAVGVRAAASAVGYVARAVTSRRSDV